MINTFWGGVEVWFDNAVDDEDALLLMFYSLQGGDFMKMVAFCTEFDRERLQLSPCTILLLVVSKLFPLGRADAVRDGVYGALLIFTIMCTLVPGSSHHPTIEAVPRCGYFFTSLTFISTVVPTHATF